MADNWDDDNEDDEWDVPDDDELDARLGLKKLAPPSAAAPVFDDEEDLALKEKVESEKSQTQELKKKGNALATKKKEEEDRKKELELARKAMEMEAEIEANLDDDELRKLKRQQVEEADHALTNDLFGGIDSQAGPAKGPTGPAQQAGDAVVMKDLKDHLKHAHKVAECLNEHGKITFATAFFKELLNESKDVLDDNAITEIIKVCNVIKNDKVQAAKKKVKGQASKLQKRDKVAEAKAKQLQVELYGDSNKFDHYDEIGERYEDDFF